MTAKETHPGSKVKAASGHVRGKGATLSGLTNNCFGCSLGNRYGLRLQFTENVAAQSVECVFRVPRRFEGPPKHVHGGIIATILDEAMGKVNRQKGIVALTRRMTIEYLRPVPLNVKLLAVGWAVRREGRKHFHLGEIRASDGTILARGEGLFIEVNVTEMFRSRSYSCSSKSHRATQPRDRGRKAATDS